MVYINIAFIMLCHTEPEQINRLLKKLGEFSSADVYIHVDLKHQEVRNQIKETEKAHILPESKSFRIEWGSIEIVKATLELIRAVKNSGKQYDYIWLISGQDYPIVSVKEIERQLEANRGTEYIDVMLPGDDRYDWYKKLYEVRYPVWINKDAFGIKVFKRLYKIATGGYCHTFKLFLKEKPFAEELAFGSQWWTLTSGAALEILDYSEQHPELVKYYKNTIIPDESFFQTLFMKTPFKDMRKASLTCSFLKDNRRHPITLTVTEYDSVKSARCVYCLARKFAENSQELLNMIDADTAKEND